MTTLLHQAMSKIEQLPIAEQDAIARRLLQELDDDLLWSQRFASTSDDQWDSLADVVRDDIKAGRTRTFRKLTT